MIPEGPDDGGEVIRTQLAGATSPMGKRSETSGGHCFSQYRPVPPPEGGPVER